METTIVTSKQIRTRLGTYMLDLKYKPTGLFLVEKPGSDDFAAVVCNAQWLRDQGVKIPLKTNTEIKEVKPEKEAKKK